MEFTSLNYIDYIALAILFISAMLSTIRGMTREFLGLVGWFVAIFIAKLTSPILVPILEGFISVVYVITPLSLVIPFLAAFIVWYVFASVVSPSLSRAGLGALDGGMGVFFGLARGAVIIVLSYLALLYLFGGSNKIPDVVKESNASRFSILLINTTKPILPNIILMQFDNLSLLEIQSPGSNTLNTDPKSAATTRNQENVETNAQNTVEFETDKKPASANLTVRAVE